jgi:hypothetical protein
MRAGGAPADALVAIGPLVADALAAIEPPTGGAQDVGRTPALDQDASEPQTAPHCKGRKKDGGACGVTRGLNEHQLCATHAGKVDHAAAARLRAEAARNRRADAVEAVQIEAERSRQGVRAAIRARVAARADDIARVLVDEALDRTNSDGESRPDVHTVLRAIEQAHGRPGEAVEQPPAAAPLTWEEEVAALVAAVGALDEGHAAAEPPQAA